MSFTQESGYPQKSVNSSGNSVVDRYYAPWAEALMAEETYTLGTECPYDARLSLQSIGISPNPSQTMGFVTLTYSTSDTVTQTDSGNYEGGCQVNASQEPISTHPSYKVKWDHGYAYKIDTAETAPADYASATSKKKTAEDWKWVRWDEQLDNTWKTDDTKPPVKAGIQSYLKPSPIVTETRYYSSMKKIGSVLQSVGTKQTPKITYGLPTSAANKYTAQSEGTFLLVGATVRKDGRKWAVDLTYQFSDTGWDGDIYA